MPGETFSKVGQENISVWLGGMQQYCFTVIARVLELDDISCLIPALPL